MLTLNDSIQKLSGIGPKLYQKLSSYGISNIADLLFHLPRNYQDRTRLCPIALLKPYQGLLFEGFIVSNKIQFGKRRSLVLIIEDDTAAIKVRFFHFGKSQQIQFAEGAKIRCFGEVRPGPSGLEIVHPEYEIDPIDFQQSDKRLTPIYPSTEGISQSLWRKLQQQAITILKHSEQELGLFQLPSHLQKLNISLKEALSYLHNPPADLDIYALENGTNPYQQRLAFEEIVAHQISFLTLRAQRRALKAPHFLKDSLSQQLLEELPFKLTQAQARTVNEIKSDCQTSTPMLRLVQGDVGSGKTVVAALAACAAISSNYQVALMAPTEILAEQHLENFQTWFEPLGIRCGWLVGKHGVKQRRQTLESLAQGDTHILIGTHAIFQEDVVFNQLGLTIIDEQHRFGVHQRLALKDKNKTLTPHQLVMTATPIPRTLAMTAYADLDLSIIDELPPGRKPIQTIALEQHRRDDVIARIDAACQEKKQAYWLCTLIEESEQLNCQAAEKTAQQLQQALPQRKIGLIHGRLKPQEKADIMQQFSQGHIELLVATTVIEVGVNVPNASLMIIENPERLGLAQLHQLRGRVGRGSAESFCVLLYQKPLSENAKARIDIMRETNDGFKIAETDLKLRGPGEVLGTRQTGQLQFRLADIERDQDLIDDASQFAKELLSKDSALAQRIVKRWINQAEYYSQA